MSPFFYHLVQFTILGYALVGGVFLAFSDFIMRALSRTGGAAGPETMQTINREVYRWVFMALFLGLTALSLIIAVIAGSRLSQTSDAFILLAGLIYLTGCFGVTAFFNVPLNEALARLDPSKAETLDYWHSTYLPRWTFWNTIRGLACGLAALLLLTALLLMAR